MKGQGALASWGLLLVLLASYASQGGSQELQTAKITRKAPLRKVTAEALAKPAIFMCVEPGMHPPGMLCTRAPVAASQGAFCTPLILNCLLCQLPVHLRTHAVA